MALVPYGPYDRKSFYSELDAYGIKPDNRKYFTYRKSKLGPRGLHRVTAAGARPKRVKYLSEKYPKVPERWYDVPYKKPTYVSRPSKIRQKFLEEMDDYEIEPENRHYFTYRKSKLGKSGVHRATSLGARPRTVKYLTEKYPQVPKSWYDVPYKKPVYVYKPKPPPDWKSILGEYSLTPSAADYLTIRGGRGVKRGTLRLRPGMRKKARAYKGGALIGKFVDPLLTKEQRKSRMKSAAALRSQKRRDMLDALDGFQAKSSIPYKKLFGQLDVDETPKRTLSSVLDYYTPMRYEDGMKRMPGNVRVGHTGLLRLRKEMISKLRKAEDAVTDAENTSRALVMAENQYADEKKKKKKTAKKTTKKSSTKKKSGGSKKKKTSNGLTKSEEAEVKRMLRSGRLIA